jgi:hypothetical protein
LLDPCRLAHHFLHLFCITRTPSRFHHRVPPETEDGALPLARCSLPQGKRRETGRDSEHDQRCGSGTCVRERIGERESGNSGKAGAVHYSKRCFHLVFPLCAGIPKTMGGRKHRSFPAGR